MLERNRSTGFYLDLFTEVSLTPLLHVPVDLLLPLFGREAAYFERRVIRRRLLRGGLWAAARAQQMLLLRPTISKHLLTCQKCKIQASREAIRWSASVISPTFPPQLSSYLLKLVSNHVNRLKNCFLQSLFSDSLRFLKLKCYNKSTCESGGLVL